MQRTVVDVHREIRDLALRLDDLERNLWDRPVDAGKVRQILAALNQKESFESWLETLPFPLASVLWRYHATAATEQKVAHLFNFFEACTVFLGTLMLSAFHSTVSFSEKTRAAGLSPKTRRIRHAIRGVSVFQAPARPVFYVFFFFRPGFTPASFLRVRSDISLLQSRTRTPPTL